MSDDVMKYFMDRIPSKPVASLVVNHSEAKPPYQSFNTKDKVERVQIRTKGQGWHTPFYHLITNISTESRAFNELFLTVSGMTISILGMNLRPIYDALILHTCEYIEEFDPEIFGPPEDRNAPLITRIDVEVIRAQAPFRRKEKEGGPA